jgi:hypothetical protein
MLHVCSIEGLRLHMGPVTTFEGMSCVRASASCAHTAVTDRQRTAYVTTYYAQLLY